MQPGMGGMGAAVGGLFLLIWLVAMGLGLVSWIIILVALWRGMRAHESIAQTLAQALGELRARGHV